MAKKPAAVEAAPEKVAEAVQVEVAKVADAPAKSKKLEPLPRDVRESLVSEVRNLFFNADALLAVLETRCDVRFAKTRNKLAETVGALR